MEPTEYPVSPRKNPVRVYFETLKQLLTRPTLFFRSVKVPVSPVPALAFALVTHWIGSALEYLWALGFAKTLNAESAGWRDIFRKLFNEIDSTDRLEALSEIQARAMHWVMGAGSVLIDPFKTTARILLQTLAIWVAARIFVPRTGPEAEERLSFSTSLAIVCFSMAASILAGLPFVGAPVSWIFSIVLMIIGTREVYRINGGRAMLIVFFPQLLLFALVLFIVAAIGVAFFKLAINFVGT